MLMILLVKSSPGRAAETNSQAVIENLFAEPLPATAPVKLLPALVVHTYRIEGKTSLSPQAFGMLSNYTGQVDAARLREGLDKLQDQYAGLGFSNLVVTVPEQKFTNEVVRLQILQADAGPHAAVALAAAVTNLFKVPEQKPTFEVRGYRVEGNTALPQEKFAVLSNYTGQVGFARVREGLGSVQLLYRDHGFVTASVTLPQQKLTNGIVRVKVLEGRLARIKVEGNRWFSTENVRRALPSLDTNVLLNTKWIQPELDRANQNQDRQIYPVIGPGLEPGTSDLTLQVKDRLPLHGHLEVNDKSTPGTPLLRLDTAVQYDNLWQRDHQLGFDYNFSPQEMKPGGAPQFYDQPMVASYSGYYRLPLGLDNGLREKYQNQSVDFGYNEVTHQFNLPPLTGRPELIAYASRSTSDTGTTFGPANTITNTATLKVFKQDAQRNPSITGNVGARFSIPLPQFGGVQSSFAAGFDVKTYQSETFYTNLTTVQIYDNSDTNSPPVLKYSDTVPLPQNEMNSVTYVPLALGWSGSRPDAQGSFSLNYNQNLFFAPFASDRKEFEQIAGSTRAGGNYTTINAGLIRQQNLPGNWSAVLNANGQWASEPLISNEQFGLGGTSGVRGYQDGANYGDTGWRTLFDLRAPAVTVGTFPSSHGDVPAHLRPSVFMDYGQVYDMRTPAPCIRQWGTGTGFYLTAGENFEARLILAWALETVSQGTTAGSARAYFTVGLQF